MASTAALQNAFAGFRARLRLPESVPPFGDRAYIVYRLFWYAAMVLALIGPAAGLYLRFSSPADNSGLMLGSRAGIVVAEEDATRIRFPVGPVTEKLGIKPGDDIVAVDGLEIPEVVPFTPIAIEKHSDEPAYLLLDDLFFGTGDMPIELRVRSTNGAERDFSITPGEQHIDDSARTSGIPPAFLGFVDLLHVLTYPFLIAAAWLLHRRQPRDPVSCILSLAILLSMATEEPSASFLDTMLGVPRQVHVSLYDIGNVFLLSGMLLFPHGIVSKRVVALIAMLPVLLFLHGDMYRALFMFFMLCAVLMQVDSLRRLKDLEIRQQIEWGLFGFSGYALFLGSSLLCDMLKWSAGSFSTQLLLEMGAGLSLGIAFLSLQLGLLVALLRFRLYDAEFVISRSASFAGVTLVMGALVAGGIQGLGDTIKSVFGSNAGAGAAGVGAAMATVLISPVHARIHKWMERRFHENLLQLKSGLPESMRDLREVADLPELLNDVVSRVHSGLPTVRSAIVVDNRVERTQNISVPETTAWLQTFLSAAEKDVCEPSDKIFRIRVPLCAHGEICLGWLLVGPRPDGTSLSKDEREVLDEVADPIARAIRIVIKREREEQDVLDALQSLTRRIEEIEARLEPPHRLAQG